MLEVHDRGPLRELRLARPPANALEPELIATLSAALDAAVEEGVEGVVLSGQPGMFSGGLDVPVLMTLDETGMRGFWSGFVGCMERIARSPVPLIAALNGHAPAGGMVLALFADTRIAAEGDYKLGLNEVQVGLPVPQLILDALSRQCGARYAEQLAVRGALISPQAAATAGLVDQIAPLDEVVDRAFDELDRMLANPRHAMVQTRDHCRADLVGLFDRFGEDDLARLLYVWFQPETQVGLRALVARLKEKQGG